MISANLLKYAKASRENGIFNNIAIQTKHANIRVNRIILFCYSTFFGKNVEIKDKFRYNSSITVKQIDATAVKELVYLMHEASVNIDRSNVTKFYVAIDFS